MIKLYSKNNIYVISLDNNPVNSLKIELLHLLDKALDWRPNEPFETGLKKTIEWYLNNEEWAEQIRSGGYRLERQGLS